MAASENALGALHNLVATILMERLQRGEEVALGDIQAAIKFLKDNNVTCEVSEDNELGKLKKELEQATGPSDEDLQAALASIEFQDARH